MCTRVIWPDAGDAVLVGRNMDFHRDLMTNLWKQPRGVARDDGVTGKLTWTSKFGSVIATAFDIISVDGINEAGLAGHVLWLAESTYGTPDDTRTQLSQAIWLQYFLDNFATVAEAVAWIAETDVQVVQLDDPTGGDPPTIHLALDDATGDSAIIEYLDGRPKVYHSKDFRVMTNSPTFDQQLELVKKLRGPRGRRAAAGFDVGRRQVRASHLLRRPAARAIQSSGSDRRHVLGDPQCRPALPDTGSGQARCLADDLAGGHGPDQSALRL